MTVLVPSFPMLQDIWTVANIKALELGVKLPTIIDRALREYLGAGVTAPVTTTGGTSVDGVNP